MKKNNLPQSRKTVLTLVLSVVVSMAAVCAQAKEYYINDASTDGDVYTERAGDDQYTGTNPCCPRASIQGIMADYTVVAGDIIYVDTGHYLMTNDMLFTAVNSGSTGLPVEIRGTTNPVMRSTFQRSMAGSGSKYGLHLVGADHVHLNNLVFTGGTAAILIEDSSGCVISNVGASGVLTYGLSVQGASDISVMDTWLRGGDTALHLEGVTNAVFSNLTVSGASGYGCRFVDSKAVLLAQSSVTRNNDAGVKFEDTSGTVLSCVLAYNVDSQVELAGGMLSLTNSILAATNAGAFCIYWTAGEYCGDYNNLYAPGTALLGRQINTNRPSLYDWVRFVTQDVHSLAHNPVFVAPTNYRLRTATTGALQVSASGMWTNHSPSIDTGPPGMDFSLEPLPNGNRVNMGAYGNTTNASQSLSSDWVLAVSLNDGGQARGAVDLRWRTSLTNAGETFRLEYAQYGKDGIAWDWELITNGLPASPGVYTWDISRVHGSPYARWRVVSESTPSLWDASDTAFQLRPYTFYINNADTMGDVYCTAPGASTNWGASSNLPMDSISGVLSAYDLEYGDLVLIDNGTYTWGSSVRILTDDGGGPDGHVTFRGGGATVIDWGISAYYLSMEDVAYIALEDLEFRRGNYGAWLKKAANCRLRNIRVVDPSKNALFLDNASTNSIENLHAISSTEDGLSIKGSVYNSLTNILVADSGWRGVFMQGNSLYNNLVNATVVGSSNDQILITGGALDLRNSIVVASGAGQFCVNVQMGAYSGDYNDLYTTNGAWVGCQGGIKATMCDWQGGGQDVRSINEDPLFADELNGDYHLKSLLGCYYKATESWITNTVHSPCIDLAQADMVYTNEPAPNGGRRNLGAYGNTGQASKGRTDPWLMTLSCGDGGIVRGATVLRWTMGNVNSNDTATVRYSIDGGVTWELVGTAVAGVESIAWNPGSLTSASCLWQVVVGTVSNQTDQPFAVNPTAYYINDDSLSNDVYCVRTGDNRYLGLRPDEPMASLEILLQVHDLQPGNVVYVDTGTYVTPSNIVISAADGGSQVGGYVTIQGSTNPPAMGTLFVNTRASGYGLHLSGGAWTELSDIVFTGSAYGVYIEDSTNCWLRRLTIRAANEAGVMFDGSRDCQLTHSVIWSNRNGVRITGGTGNNGISFCTIAYNTDDQVNFASGYLELFNSILVAQGAGSYCIYESAGLYSYAGDYNDLYTEGGAYVGYANAQNRPTLSDWYIASGGQDGSSLAHEPLFADPAAGNFHLMSTVGRYDEYADTWVQDMQHSPCIDTADPWADIYNIEPEPNGGVANIGAYGQSAQASKSTNIWITAITYNDGGTARGEVTLRWATVTNMPGTVQLIYLPGNGDEIIITNGVPATNGICQWDTALTVAGFQGSPIAQWRVRSESNPNIYDTIDHTFELRPFTLFVNDGYTINDRYCNRPGRPFNSGVFSNVPLNSLVRVLDEYDLEYDDTVYVDTGFYASLATVHFTAADAGSTNGLLYIQGSTNGVGARFVADPSPLSTVKAHVHIDVADYIQLSDLKFEGSAHGIHIESAENILLDGITVERTTNVGILVENSTSNQFFGIRIQETTTNGLALISSSGNTVSNSIFWANEGAGAYISGNNNYFENCVFAANQSNQIILADGSISLYYNIIVSALPYTYGLYLKNGIYQGNYNNWFHTNGAYVAWHQGSKACLSDWQSASGGWDWSSQANEPFFVDEVLGDFHLRSRAVEGTYVSATHTWVMFPEHSPCIDACDPFASATNEPSPNGDRRNLGAYGNTAEASKSLTNSWVSVLSYNDGGVARHTADLYWLAYAAGSGEYIDLHYSLDAGATWTLLTSTLIDYGYFSYEWDISGLTNYPDVKWKVTLQSDTNVTDESDACFAINPMRYYVNDASTNGDIYCSVAGDALFDGLNTNRPAPDVAMLLDIHDIEPGGTVFIDTGVYAHDVDVIVTSNDMGSAQAPVRFKGSANHAFGGSLFIPGTGVEGAFIIDEAEYVEVHELCFSGTEYGVYAADAVGCVLSNLTVRNTAREGIYVNGMDGVKLCRLDVMGSGNDGLYADGDGMLVSRCASWRNTKSGFTIKGISNTVEHCVATGNTNSQFVLASGSANFRCNIAVNTSTNGYAIRHDGNAYVGDYNDFYTATNCLLASKGGKAQPYLCDWQRVTTQDVYSLSHRPWFVDEALGDFHLRSSTASGTVVGVDGLRTNFAEHSPCIDAGPVFGAVTNEPTPHGGYINLGLYGNTAEASLSDTNDWLLAISFNDGGTARGTNVPLRWRSGMQVPSTPLQIDFSRDNGANWEVIATNLPASDELYAWDTTLCLGSPFARWRVSAGSATDVVDRSFYVRPLLLYVNDDATAGDIYCANVGLESATGTSSNDPLPSLQEVVDRYDLDYGDTVYIDTGFYVVTNGWVLSAEDSGSSSGMVRIVGSTNTAAGGTQIYDPQTNINSRGLMLNASAYVQASWLAFTGAWHGVELSGASDCALENIIIRNALSAGLLIDEGDSNALAQVVIERCAGNGLQIASADDTALRDIQVSACGSNALFADRADGLTVYRSRFLASAHHGLASYGTDGLALSNCVVARNQGHGLHADGGDVTLINCSLVSNEQYGVFADSASLAMRYSIVTASGGGNYCMYLTEDYAGNYNNLYPAHGALAGFYTYPRIALADWQSATTQDVLSLTHEPLFVDPLNDDYHLQSISGHYTPTGWVANVEHSSCIDAGAPFSFGMTNEPDPNGGRINLGAYGNTVEASLSSTNGRVVALSQNDGGVYRNPLTLRWLADSAVTTVDLEYSTNGVDWITIAVGVNAGVGTNTWVITNSCIDMLWRVVASTWTDVVDRVFTVNPEAFYVNDTNTVGDVFCTAPGHVTNRGIRASAPALRLQDLLDLNDLEERDTVYVDSGYYNPTSTIIFSAQDSGGTGGYVTVCGNTNPAPMTFFQWPANKDGLRLDDARDVAIVNMVMSNGDYAINMEDTTRCLVSNVTIAGAAKAAVYMKGVSNAVDSCRLFNGKVGVYTEGNHARILRSVIWSNAGSGIYIKNSDNVRCENNVLWRNADPGLYVDGGSNWIENCTLVDNRGAQVSLDGDSAWLYNNIIATADTNGYCINHSIDQYVGDYNDLYTGRGGAVGLLKDDVLFLADWQRATTQDIYSLNRDPLFVDRDAGDLHLRSITESGTWVNVLGARTNFSEHSPCIDAGPVFTLATNEPDPNGGRINLGAYGQTEWASLSRTNPWLLVLSLNDGGIYEMPTNMALRWNYGNMSAGTPVDLWITRDDGNTWLSAASNITVGAQFVDWSATNLAGSPLCHWLITTGSVSDAIADTNVAPFSLHPFMCFVNDTQTLNDVYCLAPGSLTNNGVSAETPQGSLQALLDRYDFGGGDQVFVDTGEYLLTNNVRFVADDSGAPGYPLFVIGSTNGSRFTRNASSNDCYGFEFDEVANLCLDGIEFVGGYSALHFTDVESCILSNLLVGQCANVGIHFGTSDSNRLAHVTVRECGAGVYINGHDNAIDHSLVFLNLLYGVRTDGAGSNRIQSCTIAYNGNGVIEGNYQIGFLSPGSVHNSIVIAEIVPGHTGREHVYCFASNTVNYYHGDYNDLYAFPNAGGIAPEYPSLTNWVSVTNQDVHSISENPWFVDAVNGDFHLQSSAPTGAWQNASSSWVSFPTNSPCIDTGYIQSDSNLEPMPNGGMINIGAYGNTEWASRSVDTDGDGLSDTFEAYARGFRWGLDPYAYKPFGSDPNLADTDGDGMDDYREYISGTDPTDTNQCFAVTQLYPTVDDHVILSWASAYERIYAIQWTTNLMLPYTYLATNLVATPPVNTYVVTNNLPVRSTFFRFLVEME
ncbi:MAG: hypothetical protein EOM20_00515 [Spartobacteria bacterium]|nr:hypothetical protein [Spartobacteria bacterium]